MKCLHVDECMHRYTYSHMNTSTNMCCFWCSSCVSFKKFHVTPIFPPKSPRFLPTSPRFLQKSPTFLQKSPMFLP